MFDYARNRIFSFFSFSYVSWMSDLIYRGKKLRRFAQRSERYTFVFSSERNCMTAEVAFLSTRELIDHVFDLCIELCILNQIELGDHTMKIES